jgi:hypothetical protein
MFGTPFGAKSESTQTIEFPYANDRISSRVLASNLIRNSALHWQTPFPRANQRLYNLVESIHHKLEFPLNDAGTTWPGTHFDIYVPVRDEDLVPNTLHALLLCLACVLLVSVPNPDLRRGRSFRHLACLFCGFVLFCALARWQPWHSRLHLAFFALAAPVVAALFAPYRTATGIVAILLFYVGISHALWNANRPLLGSESVFKKTEMQVLFTKRPHLQQTYEALLGLLDEQGARRVGLILDNDDWEYPLWRTPTPRTSESRIFRHVMVDNITGNFEDSAWVPDALISLREAEPDTLEFLDQRFHKIPGTAGFTMYSPGVSDELPATRDGTDER